VWIFAVDAYCADHPNASRCTLSSPQGEIGAIVIAVVIVALVVFDIAWKLGRGSHGPLARVLLAGASAVPRLTKRRAP
jgi:hypothetical protein